MYDIDCPEPNKFCTYEVTKLSNARLSGYQIEERLSIASMSQMFSFWREIQDVLVSASEEIKTLKSKIKELEEKNVKVS
jgi:hypothetical protein